LRRLATPPKNDDGEENGVRPTASPLELLGLAAIAIVLVVVKPR